MLKPSYKSKEGWLFTIIIINALGMLWYLVTKQPPPMPDPEVLMKYAKDADNVAQVLKLIADQNDSLNVDFTKLGEMGGLGGFVAFIYQYFVKARTRLKEVDLQVSGENKVELPIDVSFIEEWAEQQKRKKEPKIE